MREDPSPVWSVFEYQAFSMGHLGGIKWEDPRSNTGCLGMEWRDLGLIKGVWEMDRGVLGSSYELVGRGCPWCSREHLGDEVGSPCSGWGT